MRSPSQVIQSIVSVGILAFIASHAHAGFIYTLRFEQTEYFVAPGGTVDVKLILREEVTGEDMNRVTDRGEKSEGRSQRAEVRGQSAVEMLKKSTSLISFQLFLTEAARE